MTNLDLFDFITAGGSRSVFDIFNSIVVFLVALSFLFVAVGVVRMILYADNKEVRTEGKQVMVWGILGVFILVSVWGLVAILVNTFGTAQVSPPYKVEIR